MVHSDRLLVALIHAFADARGLSVSYASRLLTGSGDTVDRVTAGASITARRAETILRRAVAEPGPPTAPGPQAFPAPHRRRRTSGEPGHDPVPAKRNASHLPLSPSPEGGGGT